MPLIRIDLVKGRSDAQRDIVRGTLRLAGWANTASGRRAHTNPGRTLTLRSIP